MVLREVILKSKQIKPLANQLSITFVMKLPASLHPTIICCDVLRNVNRGLLWLKSSFCKLLTFIAMS